MEPDKKMASAASVMRIYGNHLKKYPWVFVCAVLSMLGIQVTELMAPLFLRSFFNTIVAIKTPDEAAVHILLGIVGILSVVWTFNWVAHRVMDFFMERLESTIMRDLYGYGFGYLIEHSYHFFISRFAGSLTHKVTKFVRAFEMMIDAFVLEFFPTALFVVGAVSILFIQNHALGIALGIWAVMFTLFQIYVSHWRQPMRVARSEAETRITANLSDVISNHATTMLFAGAVTEKSRFANTVRAWYEALRRAWKADSAIWAGFGAMTLIIQVVLFYIATIYWGRGQLTVGDFVLMQAYLITTFNRLVSINRTLRRFYDALADAQEMVAILEEPHGVRDVDGAALLAVARGAVDFKDVTFRFHENRPILEHLDLSIRPGEKVALVGPSGAGKSTITKLLLRMYDVTNGAILIDGQNISQVTQDSLREAIGFVPQEPVLFHRSLMENIRYGKRDATDEEAIEAARKAHCHEFIQGLAQGYDTFVGERGVKLSGGERQRVAIARAILKDAPILVLDEATSSLDSESESLIQDSLRVLMQGKTVLVIAHRLSTIMNMDRIVVLQDGKIVADGTHDELLKEGGLYQKLWSIQAGGFIKDEDE